jgi:hypothetical protein
MDSKHPFLDKAYLWFDPTDHFFPYNKRSNETLSLRWERLDRIRRIVPTSRIVDPDCGTVRKKVPPNPVYVPNMRTIVGALCPNVVQLEPMLRSIPATSRVDREEGHGRPGIAGTSGVRVGGTHGPFPNEDVGIGSETGINWDWWGSSRSKFTQHTIRLW